MRSYDHTIVRTKHISVFFIIRLALPTCRFTVKTCHPHYPLHSSIHCPHSNAASYFRPYKQVGETDEKFTLLKRTVRLLTQCRRKDINCAVDNNTYCVYGRFTLIDSQQSYLVKVVTEFSLFHRV